jgi:hypothetical protein
MVYIATTGLKALVTDASLRERTGRLYDVCTYRLHSCISVGQESDCILLIHVSIYMNVIPSSKKVFNYRPSKKINITDEKCRGVDQLMTKLKL